MYICASEFYFNLIITLHILKTNQQLFLSIDNNSLDKKSAILYPPPLTAPTNFSLTKVIDGHTAAFRWNPLPKETQHGRLSGYKIQIWSDVTGNSNDLLYPPSAIKARIDSFIPFSTNYVRLYGFTDVVDGPTTDVISFETPEWIPGPVASFDAIPMSRHSIYLKWKRPVNANGILIGFHVYLSTNFKKKFTSNDSYTMIGDPWITGLKITDLEADTKYRFTISAVTAVGEGTPFSTDGKTEFISKMPDVPTVIWHQLPNVDGKAAFKVIWQPDEEDHIGDEFFLAYKEGQGNWSQVESDEVWDQIVVKNLKFSTEYEVRAVAIDGEFARRSNVMVVKTAGSEERVLRQYNNKNDVVVRGRSDDVRDKNMLSLKKLVKCLSDQLLD